MVVISAAFASRPADTQATAAQLPRAAPEGGSMLRKPPVRASRMIITPHTASTPATSQGRKLGPMPP